MHHLLHSKAVDVPCLAIVDVHNLKELQFAQAYIGTRCRLASLSLSYTRAGCAGIAPRFALHYNPSAFIQNETQPSSLQASADPRVHSVSTCCFSDPKQHVSRYLELLKNSTTLPLHGTQHVKQLLHLHLIKHEDLMQDLARGMIP